jgi:CHAT domain-containing protein/tetratricopeptide (TPR) repeat protein
MKPSAVVPRALRWRAPAALVAARRRARAALPVWCRRARTALAVSCAIGHAAAAEPAPAVPSVPSTPSARSAPPAVERARTRACSGKTTGMLARACASAARDPQAAMTAFELATAFALDDNADQARELADELSTRPDLGPWGAARLELLRGWIIQAAGRQGEAAAYYERALAALRARPGAPADLMADALVAQASVIVAFDKTAGAKAQALLDEAQSLLAAAGMSVSYSMTSVLNHRTVLAAARDDWDAVLMWAERERDMVRRVEGPDTPEELDAIVTLSAATSTLRRYAETLRWLELGRRIGQRWPHARPRAYLGILNSMVVVLPELGRTAEALEISDEAIRLAIANWGERSAHLVTTLDRRARIEESLGRFADARATNERVLDMLRTEGAHVTLERRLRMLDASAAFFLRLNDVDAAQRMLDDVNALLPGDDSMKYWRGRSHQRAATIAAAENRWADADALLEKAMPLLAARVGTSSPYVVAAAALRCTAQLRAGLDARACAALAERLPTLDVATPSERLRVRRVMADYALAQGRTNDAIDHALYALAAGAFDHAASRRWTALDGVAGSLHAMGQRAHAVLFAKAAVEQIEAERDALASAPDLEPSYLRDKHAVYRRLADWLAEAGRIDEALAVLRLLQVREYDDFVRGHTSDEPPSPGAAPAAAPSARHEVSKASAEQVGPPRSAGNATPSARRPHDRVPWTEGERLWRNASRFSEPMPVAPLGPNAVQRIQELERARVQAWRRALALEVADAATATNGASSTARTTIDDGDLRATVFLGERHVNTVLESADARRLVRTPADTAAIVRDIGRLTAAIERRDDVLPLLRSLHARVAQPIDVEARRIGAHRVRLRVDGELRYLPFGALHDGSAHLVTRLAIRQVAFGAEQAQPREPASESPWVRAFGSTRAANGSSALPGVAAEICEIVDGDVSTGARAQACAPSKTRGAFRGQGWIDDAFTAQRLRDAAAAGRAERYDLLHIGGHFVLRPGEIGASWLQLGDGTRLPLHDMLRWRLDSQDVVTLAACETGAGGGAELDGMASLLLKRGAGSVLASLWPVDDRSTARLIADAYRRLRASRDPAAALRDAQLDALEDRARAHPYHWAAFTVTSAER